MKNASGFASLTPTALADVLDRTRVMDVGIRPLWAGMPRIAGPAFPVVCVPGDNLMLHAAIYRAAPGSVIVVQVGDTDFAVAGGNVCAVAQQNGIAGFVVDGAIRDLGEIRAMRFPVFARGIMPKPGEKKVATPAGEPASCGGVLVELGDLVVADEEGIVVVPSERIEDTLSAALSKAQHAEDETLDSWQTSHHAKISAALAARGFTL